MNEDEAFIRAIVDSPGDDAPRLVYADWLDDRDDPRGPYLRAEREVVETGHSTRLRELAAGLDPVWIARVSRPPIGVCFDSTLLGSVGPTLSANDLDRFEADVGLPLTNNYRALLLNLNGGATNGADPAHCFYSLMTDGLVPNRRSLLFHAKGFRSWRPAFVGAELWGAEPGDEPWFADALPIAASGDDFVLFYAVRGKYEGRLHFHDYTGDWCTFGFIAGPHGPPTLPEFLHRLPQAQQAGHGLTETYPGQPLQEFWK